MTKRFTIRGITRVQIRTNGTRRPSGTVITKITGPNGTKTIRKSF